MHSSSCAPKCFVLVPILTLLAVQLSLIRSVLSLNTTNAYLHHKCFVNQGKYKPGSGYEKNLTSITHNIPRSNNFSGGFAMSSLQYGPMFVSVVLQCRGDSYGPKCGACYATALSGLRRRCLRNKGGIIWYDQCFLEFSGVDTSFQNDYDNNLCMTNPKKVNGDADAFLQEWLGLLGNLTTIASKKNISDPTILYAAGEKKFGKETLYAMMQCTADAGEKGCHECFRYDILTFQDCLKGKRGGRVLGRSCNFRFELYPFVSSKHPDIRQFEIAR